MTSFRTGIKKGEDSFQTGKKAAESALEKMKDDKVDFAIVFSSSEYDYKKVVSGVREATDNVELIGCSTAGEFTEEGPEKGSVAVALVSSKNHKFFTGLGKGLRDNPEKAVGEAGSDLPDSVEGYPNRCAINLHDGLAGKGTQVVWESLEVLGQDVKLVGGSAGDDLKMNETCVFQNDKVESDSVGLGLLASKDPIIAVVRHGHKPLSSPLTVTKSEGNTVYEIDGEPAFEVWKEEIREDAEEELGINVDKLEDESKELAELLTRYEFGIQAARGYKVRWPGPTQETGGALKFACKIPEGSVVRVMTSPKKKQIQAARDAAKTAMEKSKDKDIAGALVFECIVRATILGDRFKESVEAMEEELGVPMLGFETYGEICVERGQMSGYHNTTTVILLIPE